MSVESEKHVEACLVKGIKQIGGWAIKLLPFEVAGLPDRLVLFDGRAYFVELKRKGKTPRRIQRIIHRRLKKVGFPVSVLDTPGKVADFITLLL